MEFEKALEALTLKFEASEKASAELKAENEKKALEAEADNKAKDEKITELEASMVEMKETETSSVEKEVELSNAEKGEKLLNYALSAKESGRSTITSAFDGTQDKGKDLNLEEIDKSVYKMIIEDNFLSNFNVTQISGGDKYVKLMLEHQYQAFYEDDTAGGADQEFSIKDSKKEYVTATIYSRTDIYLEAYENAKGSGINIFNETKIGSFIAIRNFLSDKIINGAQVDSIKGMKNEPDLKVKVSTETAVADLKRSDIISNLNNINPDLVQSSANGNIITVSGNYTYTTLAGIDSPNSPLFTEIKELNGNTLITSIGGSKYVSSRYAPGYDETTTNTSGEVLLSFLPDYYILVNQVIENTLEIGYINGNMLKQLQTIIYRSKWAGGMLFGDAASLLKITVV